MTQLHASVLFQLLGSDSRRNATMASYALLRI